MKLWSYFQVVRPDFLFSHIFDKIEEVLRKQNPRFKNRIIKNYIFGI